MYNCSKPRASIIFLHKFNIILLQTIIGVLDYKIGNKLRSKSLSEQVWQQQRKIMQ